MSKRIAIVGASNDRRKYGNKAVRAFLQGGWTVFPVNPVGGTIEGVEAYADLTGVPQPLDEVSMYVPPAVGIKLLDTIAAMEHGELYLNPGSESPALLARAKELGLNPIQACTIVNIGLRPGMFPDH